MSTHDRAPLTFEQQRALMGSLNPARVQTRTQAGATLSYLEAHDVKVTLIRLFGFGGFSAEVIDPKIIFQETVPRSSGTGTNWKIAAQATVRLTIHQLGAVYTETAVAGSTQPDYTEAADMALKSAESDALKRAAVYLGTQYGASLYAGTTSDVVRVVFAPGQQWPRPEPAQTPPPAIPTVGTPDEQKPEVAPTTSGAPDEPTFEDAEALLTSQFGAKEVQS